MEPFGSFRRSTGRQAMRSCLQICFDYISSVKILYECDEASLTVTRIAVSLML